ncbi:hypothetical protein EJ06DRAFT_46318 [Trichodelitschia bisporula]|uniref:Uncharacterized protein n=1 Tax=Trichodelitschia bisporula TaxID=703511 RepID=A0A6G1HVP3_9PEZI|nr:hypothetical protein EJ06DRAFT_46318 [Trichodelitschia bisporula]
MPLLDLRGLVPFPGGDAGNATDSIINGVHFNKTALNYWNYTLYSNNTISNNSKCYIIFDQYKPVFMSNGSWVNATTCYVPVFGIKQRGSLGVAFGALFGISIMFTLMNLKKHGQQFLQEDKRFRIVGRRWQWYWMLFAATCGIISCFTSVDVDRDYLPELPIILQSFFFMLTLNGLLGAVWEGTRHWGSWQERQIVDRDPYTLRQDDTRSKYEFYLPLVFYFFNWLNFFMVIPRSWTAIQKQRSPEQTAAIAEPAATDARFKVGAIFATIAWGIIVYSLQLSMHYYRPHQRGLWSSFDNFLKHCPTKLFLGIMVSGIRVAYALASAWVWDINLLNMEVAPGWPYGLGYAPVLLIFIIFNIFGFIDDNEDRIIIKQRRERGRTFDAELGIKYKPNWWSKMNGNYKHAMTPDERLRAMVEEVPPRQSREENRGVTDAVERSMLDI